MYKYYLKISLNKRVSLIILVGHKNFALTAMDNVFYWTAEQTLGSYIEK